MFFSVCGGMNEMSPISLRHLNIWFPVDGCLRRNRRYDLTGGSMALRVDFGVPKESPFRVCCLL